MRESGKMTKVGRWHFFFFSLSLSLFLRVLFYLNKNHNILKRMAKARIHTLMAHAITVIGKTISKRDSVLRSGQVDISKS
jgi:hypothetical protein